jgi:putative oxidoreductase
MAFVSTVMHSTVTPLLLRLGLAVIFVYHGWEKVSTPGFEYGARWMGDAQPAPVQFAVAWGELLGGAALALGLLTRLAALGIVVIMAGAIALFHGKNGFGLQNQGFERDFAIIVMCLPLILGGGGWLALDRFITLRRRGRSADYRGTAGR